MDKNTLTGLVLMAAVMFGFFWLTKPSEAEIAAERARQEQAANEALEAARAQSEKASAVAFEPADSAALAGAVRAMGTAAADGTVTFTNENLKLTLDSVAGLSGVYVDGDESVAINDLLANRATVTAARSARAAKAVHAVIDNAVKYEGFARHLSGDNSDIVLENDLIKVTLSTRGGRVSQVELKNYKTEVGPEPSNILLFRDDNDGYGFKFNTADQRIDTRDFNFTPVVEGDTAVTMMLLPDNKSAWGIRYTLAADAYTLRMDIVQKGMGAILPANTSSMEFDWRQKMARNELGKTFEERNSAIYYKYIGESVDELESIKDDHESLTGRIRWVAFKNQFFSSVIIARDCFTTADLTSTDLKGDVYLKDMSMIATLPYTVADGTAASFDFYFGPNDYPILSGLDATLGHDEDLSLTRLIPLGWGLFRWINTLIVIPVFTFLGSFISNYGIIILLLTIFIKLIIFPFTFKSFKSQAKMRVLAPEIKEINDKYPDQADAMKRQQETMALYSRVGASPFSGCLPMLLQMPVLIAMFSFFPSAIELRGQSFLWAHDLSAPDSIFTLPFSIPFYGNHVSLFCLLMTVINIVYMKVSMQSQPQSAGMPGMKMMSYIMPVMFLFIFNDYASGLSYYYLLSLLITIIQTWVFRKVMDENKVREQLLENARKPRKKSGWMARLEEAQKQAEAAQRQQARQNAKRRR
ncbi:MAG: membrane protein insertase YidC [Muribaculaceae bacterium]|nr:membrane protein insertase YidC [Muribaculaceae bacterium]